MNVQGQISRYSRPGDGNFYSGHSQPIGFSAHASYYRNDYEPAGDYYHASDDYDSYDRNYEDDYAYNTYPNRGGHEYEFRNDYNNGNYRNQYNYGNYRGGYAHYDNDYSYNPEFGSDYSDRGRYYDDYSVDRYRNDNNNYRSDNRNYGRANERRTSNRSGRGFASMDRDRLREIASRGGRAAHDSGRAHEWNSREAREAGRRGGEGRRQSRSGSDDYRSVSSRNRGDRQYASTDYNRDRRDNWSGERDYNRDREDSYYADRSRRHPEYDSSYSRRDSGYHGRNDAGERGFESISRRRVREIAGAGGNGSYRGRNRNYEYTNQ